VLTVRMIFMVKQTTMKKTKENRNLESLFKFYKLTNETTFTWQPLGMNFAMWPTTSGNVIFCSQSKVTMAISSWLVLPGLARSADPLSTCPINHSTAHLAGGFILPTWPTHSQTLSSPNTPLSKEQAIRTSNNQLRLTYILQMIGVS